MVCKLSKCRIFKIPVFLLIPLVSSSQYEISGIVSSNSQDPLPFANVTIHDIDDTALISYAITDENGKYNVKIENGFYLFKVSHLGYKSISVEKNISKSEIINFSLLEDATSLDEIVIKSKLLDATMSNDTIRFNLDQLATGNEENLKDVLNKLPGIEVDKNGKIRAHGKKIDKLLIDGQEFFGDQHQLATENISSEMIKGISMLENFSDFSELENREKTEKTAINVEIGENYKGNIKGNIFLAGGAYKKHESNTNLFLLGKHTHLFIIANTNNIGNQTFTFEDYISFQGGIQKLLSENSNVTSISGNDLPSYLFSNRNFKSKSEQFSGINFSYNPSKKFKVNSYIILDKMDVTEEQLAKQTYIRDGNNTFLNLNNTKDNSFLTGNSFVNAIYKPTNTSVFEYSLSISPQDIRLVSNDEFAKRTFNTIQNNESHVLNHALKHKLKINDFLLSSTLYQAFKRRKEGLSLFSNSSFLNLSLNDDFSVFQNINSSINSFGLNTAFSGKLTKKTSVKIKYNVSKSKETFFSDISNSSLKNNIRLDVLENLVGLSLYSKKKTFINYDLGCDLSVLNRNHFKSYNFLPFANIKFNLKKSHSLNLSYKRTLKLPQAENLLESSYILNFNTLINNQNIIAGTTAKYNNYSLRYFIYDLFSSTLLSIGGSLIIGKDIIATNTFNFSDFRINNFFLGNNSKNIHSYLLFDKKFSKIPMRFRLKSTFLLSEKNNFINSIANKLNSNTISNKIELSSNFRKSFFNFELGYIKTQSIIKNNALNGSRLVLNKPLLNLHFNYKKFDLTVDNTVEYYKTNTFNQRIYIINPTLNYKTRAAKWTFYLKGNDILNLNKNSIIENAAYESYFEEKTVLTLGGFVVGGLKYAF